jgi:hypothetical protein
LIILSKLTTPIENQLKTWSSLYPDLIQTHQITPTELGFPLQPNTKELLSVSTQVLRFSLLDPSFDISVFIDPALLSFSYKNKKSLKSASIFGINFHHDGLYVHFYTLTDPGIPDSKIFYLDNDLVIYSSKDNELSALQSALKKRISLLSPFLTHLNEPRALSTMLLSDYHFFLKNYACLWINNPSLPLNESMLLRSIAGDVFTENFAINRQLLQLYITGASCRNKSPYILKNELTMSLLETLLGTSSSEKILYFILSYADLNRSELDSSFAQDLKRWLTREWLSMNTAEQLYSSIILNSTIDLMSCLLKT